LTEACKVSTILNTYCTHLMTEIYIIFILIFLWLSGLTYFLYRVLSHYNNLVEKTNKKTLTEVLDKVLNNTDVNKKSVSEIRRALQILTDKSQYHIQKLGLVKFNPFAESGGNQSFVMAVLDGKNSGIVLTSLANRGVTRWYAKKIKNGSGVDFKLSDEEKTAIKEAGYIQLKKL
jgi:hypothetical protein